MGLVSFIHEKIVNGTLSSADKLAAAGKIAEAEEKYRKIWAEHNDAPAHMAEMYFGCAKRELKDTKKCVGFLTKVFQIKDTGLNDASARNLADAKGKVLTYVSDKANKAYKAADYDTAISFISVIENLGQKYKEKKVRYCTRKYCNTYLKGKTRVKDLEDVLKNSRSALEEMLDIVKELNAAKSFQEAAELAGLAMSNPEAAGLFKESVISQLKEDSSIICQDSSLKNQAIDVAEEYADSIRDDQFHKLEYYIAVKNARPGTGITEKIEAARFTLAEGYLNNYHYSEFLYCQSVFETDNDVSPAFRDIYKKKYDDVHFAYLKERLKLDTSINDKILDKFLEIIENPADKERYESTLDTARMLQNKSWHAASNQICAKMAQDDEKVQTIVIENSIAIVNGLSAEQDLSKVYGDAVLYSAISQALLSRSKEELEKGEFSKSIVFCKTALPHCNDKPAANLILLESLARNLENVASGETNRCLNEIESIVSSLSKKTGTRSQAYGILEVVCKSYVDKKRFLPVYHICDFARIQGGCFSEMYIESCHALCKKEFQIDTNHLKSEIDKCGDPLKEYEYFKSYIPEFNKYYLDCTFLKISCLHHSDANAAITAFDEVSGDSDKAYILNETLKNPALFKDLAVFMLDNKAKRLEKYPILRKSLITGLSKFNDDEFAVLCLRNLASCFNDADEAYAGKVLKSIKSKGLQEQLDAINHALEVSADTGLLNHKKGIAAELVKKGANDQAIAICDELEGKVDELNPIFFKAYYNKAASTASVNDKITFIKKAGAYCSGKDYSPLAEMAAKASETLFALNRNQDAYSLLEEIPSASGDEIFLKHKIEESRNTTADTAAMSILEGAIDYIIKNGNTAAKSYPQAWEEYVSRAIHKSESQAKAKAIESLDKVSTNLLNSGTAYVTQLLQRVKGRLHDLNLEYGKELEEGSLLQAAQKCYRSANSYQESPEAQGRAAICSVKRKDVPVMDALSEFKQIVGLPTIPVAIKKDLAYRLSIRLIKEGKINEAEEVVKEHLRSRQLLNLCECYKLKRVKDSVKKINDGIDAVTSGKMGLDEAQKLLDTISQDKDSISGVYPEYRGLLDSYQIKLRPYIINSAFKSGQYQLAYTMLRQENTDFYSDDILFRNLAVACLGIIEEGGLNNRNYKELISIWLTAVFSDRLIVKSLDYTSWDDGYTFCLDDSLSQTYEYDNLPGNINFDDPSDTNISIGSVQRSLLEHTEGILSKGEKTFYDFYISQRDAMTALVDLYGSSTGDAMAPFILTLLPSNYKSDLEQRLIWTSSQDDDALMIGYMYGFTNKVFREYKNAKDASDSCINAARDLSNCQTAFSATNINLIKNISSLYGSLVSSVSEIMGQHYSSEVDYETLLNEGYHICLALNDNGIKHSFAEYLNAKLVQKLKRKEMSEEDGLMKLYTVYKCASNHSQLKQNLQAVISNIIGRYVNEGSSQSIYALNSFIPKTRLFDDDIIKAVVNAGPENDFEMSRARAILDKLLENSPGKAADVKKAKDDFEIFGTVAKVLEGAKNGTSNFLNDLRTMYNLYLTHKNHEIVCVVLAQIASECISQYIQPGKYQAYDVKSILNNLANNQSSKFMEQSHYFQKKLDDIRSKFGFKYYELISLPDYQLSDKGKSLKEAITYLEKFC